MGTGAEPVTEERMIACPEQNVFHAHFVHVGGGGGVLACACRLLFVNVESRGYSY
ncbi:MAG: hypothetical protein QXI37_00970 [Thermoprotei archaeon]